MQTTETREVLRVKWTLGSYDDPYPEGGECSLSDWLDSNEDVLESTADLLAFARGETVRGGGGAAPEWTATLIVNGGAA